MECFNADPVEFSLFARLEKVVRDAVFKGEHDKIKKIVDQLCHDYAYAVHQPHARNGGLIGLAATSIALGTVSRPRICYGFKLFAGR